MRFARIAAALAAALALTLVGAPAAAAQTVLVVGGTPAGVAAALAAARRGADVTLVARRGVLGGILTDAMMDQWDLDVDAHGTNLAGGIFREIYGALGDAFTPQAAAHTFAALVAAEPRIRLILNARAIAVRTAENGTGRSVESVSFLDARAGRAFEIAAPYVVDATDDGDVAALAGAAFTLGRADNGPDERMQPVTLMFTLTGVDWHALAAGYDPHRDGAGGVTADRAWGYARTLKAYRPLAADVIVPDLNLGRERSGNVTVNAIDVDGVDGRFDAELVRGRRLAEAEIPHLLAFMRAHVAGCANARFERAADALYVRETRHFVGLDRLTGIDVWNGKIPPDTIGLSSYPLDIHPVAPGDRPAYATVRHVYGVPFGSLVPRDFTNLVLASPAISATHIAAGSARVIPTTIEEGEAAGAAAAFAAAHNLTFPALGTSAPLRDAFRSDLRAHGALLPA